MNAYIQPLFIKNSTGWKHYFLQPYTYMILLSSEFCVYKDPRWALYHLCDSRIYLKYVWFRNLINKILSTVLHATDTLC